jgi:phage host-nuclease inhibitor protein Gam
MFKFIKNIKELYALIQRVQTLDSEMNQLNTVLNDAVANYSKQFEKKIQEMTFAYTKNLDDTKSTYLKKYLEVRMDCIQDQINTIPQQLLAMEQGLKSLILKEDE